MASRELISPADLTRAQFVVPMKRRFLQRLVWMGALRGSTRASFLGIPGLTSLQTLLVVIQVDVWLLGKKWSFDRFIIIIITIVTNLSILSQVPDADEFSADLVMELVPLPTSILSHVPDTDEFSADLVVVVRSIEVSGPANLLKPWMKR